jgi:hypothetical protein
MSVRIEVQAVGCRYERRLKLGSIVCKTLFSLSLEPLFVNMLVEDRGRFARGDCCMLRTVVQHHGRHDD